MNEAEEDAGKARVDAAIGAPRSPAFESLTYKLVRDPLDDLNRRVDEALRKAKPFELDGLWNLLWLLAGLSAIVGVPAGIFGLVWLLDKSPPWFEALLASKPWVAAYYDLIIDPPPWAPPLRDFLAQILTEKTPSLEVLTTICAVVYWLLAAVFFSAVLRVPYVLLRRRRMPWISVALSTALLGPLVAAMVMHGVGL
jgi:hypothetical protein